MTTTAVKTRVENMVARVDGWFSTLTGIGTTLDKRTTAQHYGAVLTESAALDLWKGNKLAAKIVEEIPKELFRPGFTVNCGDKDLTEALMARTEELGVKASYTQALKLHRALGGAAIFPVVNDGGNLSQPLNPKRVPRIESLMVLEPHEIQPAQKYQSLGPLYGKPELYRVRASSTAGANAPEVLIHASRLILWRGIQTSDRSGSMTTGGDGWGDSVLNRVNEILADFGMAWGATGLMLQDFSQSVYKIKGLSGAIKATKGDDYIKARIRGVELARSVVRAVLIDEGEEFERKQVPVSGLAELLREMATLIAAVADMPVTKLFGVSPAGLNATGESDTRNWYDQVSAVGEDDALPQIEALVKLLFLSLDGPTRGKEPDTWSVEFNPLYAPSDEETAKTRKTHAETVAILVQNSVISPEEAAESMFGGDTYSGDITIDWAARKMLADAPLPEVPPTEDAPTESTEDIPATGVTP